jgi:hypothetical protein
MILSKFLLRALFLLVLCSASSILWSIGLFASSPSFCDVSLASHSTTMAGSRQISAIHRDINGGKILPLLANRTMYAAGYDARTAVTFSKNPRLSWQWTGETEQRFAALYNVAMNRTECNRNVTLHAQRQSTIRVVKQQWGLGSRIRDTMDVIMAGMDVKRTVLHDGPRECPFTNDKTSNNNTQDPYMICLFQPFSRCQGVSPLSQNLTAIRRAWGLFHDMPPGVLVPDKRYWQRNINVAIDRWWDDLLQHGLVARKYDIHGGCNEKQTPPKATKSQKLSVIRALLAHSLFSPSRVSKWVQTRVHQLEEMAVAVNMQAPTLVVHLRRTDKANDNAAMYIHEQRKSMKETLVVLRALIRAAERMPGDHRQFRSIFFMSDEPRAFSPEILAYLSATLPSRPAIFFNNYVYATLGNHSNYTSQGHEAFLSSQEHDIMDKEFVASITLAAKHASYIVGYGRSGVSQLISQLLGTKHRMCPSQVSLFEDDMVLLKDLPETQDWFWYIRNSPTKIKNMTKTATANNHGRNKATEEVKIAEMKKQQRRMNKKKK